jgi:hypothetical protein
MATDMIGKIEIEATQSTNTPLWHLDATRAIDVMASSHMCQLGNN